MGTTLIHNGNSYDFHKMLLQFLSRHLSASDTKWRTNKPTEPFFLLDPESGRRLWQLRIVFQEVTGFTTSLTART